MKKTIFLAAVGVLCSTFALANDSACGKTTHGAPLRAKAEKINMGEPGTLPKFLGPAQLETTDGSKKISVWYDILHESSGTATSYSRRDCGVAIAAISDGVTTKTTLKALQAEDIDLILAGKAPRL